MSSCVSLYSREDLHRVEWPDTEDGRYARDYLDPLMAHGAVKYMTNVDTTVLLARVDDLVLPLTVNDAEYGNSYVCAPYTHY
ncbi:MAG: family N-acetyltransferase, partial [Paenibacillaceae bacterium]|nr:family N-acetyltransferase [Paenibacillaceae bacterium]